MFAIFHAQLSWVKFLSHKVISCANDYTEPMATPTAWLKINSTKYFCNARVGGELGEIFVLRKLTAVQ